MKTQEHTAGPWKPFNHAGANMRSYSQSSGVVGPNGNQIICGCFSDIGGEKVAAANARLIAAAPQLLEALNCIAAYNPSIDSSGRVCFRLKQSDYDLIGAAIRSAKGETL